MEKKKAVAFILVLALCGCAVFGWLWQQEKNDTSDLEQVCIYAAGNANSRFSDYLSYGSEYDYHYGVAELTAFYDAYCIYRVDAEGERGVNCAYVNQLLGELMDPPELNEDQIKMLIELTELLKDNPDDANAYILIFGLYNELTR